MRGRGKEVLIASQAPKALGPYSAGIRSDGMIFTSGNIGIDPATGKLVEGGIEAETRQALANLSAVLAAGGSSLERVLKTTVFLADMDDYAAMNQVYAEHFGQDPPARSAVQVVRLPGGAIVEIEAIAVVEERLGD